MAFASQYLFTTSSSRFTLYFNTSSPLKNPNISLSVTSRLNFPFLAVTDKSLRICGSEVVNSHRYRLRAYDSEGRIRRNDGELLNFDYFLSIAELVCLCSSTIVWIGLGVNYVISGAKKTVMEVMGEKLLVWGVVTLVGGSVIGAWIRRRQWRRNCGEVANGGGDNLNLVERIEKAEEDFRSLATIVRALSRQLEKLGIRFRVTRKALKEPTAETAALAQKNSEATRALAVQADILEKELGEVQKVLLAMQDQQQKQLELILAVVKNGKLGESKRDQVKDLSKTVKPAEEVKQIETYPQNSNIS